MSTSDTLQTKENEKKTIDSIEYSYKSKKVFNFAVADWQTYFVGLWAWLVHNVCLSDMILQSQKWFQNVRRGYFFNLVWNSELRKQAIEKGFKYFQEVKVILTNGKKGAIDGLIRMKNGTYKIIERKASDLTKVKDSTIKDYINDAAKYNGSKVIENGTKIEVEEVILHVEKVGELSTEVITHASGKGVTIVDNILHIFN